MLFRRITFAIPCMLTLSINTTQANELLNVLENSQADITSLSSLKQGDSLRFSLQIAGQPLDTTDLQRIDVFAPEAQINLQGKNGITSISAPKTNYFSGQIIGVTDSHVFLDLTNLQSIKGIISLKDKIYIYNNESTSSQSRQIVNKQIPTQSATDIFQCLTENTQTEKYLSKPLTELDLSSLKVRATTDKNTYISNLTIESDYEYYSLFNDSNKAIKYTADLIAYTSSIYKRELNSILKPKNKET